MGQASPPLDPGLTVQLFLPLPSMVHFQHRGWNDHLKMYIRSCPSSVTFLHASGVAQSQGPSACSPLAPGGTCCLCQLALLQPHLLPLLAPSSRVLPQGLHTGSPLCLEHSAPPQESPQPGPILPCNLDSNSCPTRLTLAFLRKIPGTGLPLLASSSFRERITASHAPCSLLTLWSVSLVGQDHSDHSIASTQRRFRPHPRT